MNIYTDLTSLCIQQRDTFIGKHYRNNFATMGIFLDLIRSRPSLIRKVVIETLREFRGMQFACGTIYLQDKDAEMLFPMKPWDMEKYYISEFMRARIPKAKNVYIDGAIIRMDPWLTPEDYAATFDFIINLIMEKEKTAEEAKNWNSYVERDSK